MKKICLGLICIVFLGLSACSGDSSSPVPPPPSPAPGVDPNDLDGDGIPNNIDNCPDVANPDQLDSDGDAFGDACDPDNNGDLDGDGIQNGADNCPNTANPDQLDLDADGTGDECDDDMDGDGIANVDDDLSTCPNTPDSDAHIFRDNVTAATIDQLRPEHCLIEGSIHLTGVVDVLKFQKLEKIGKVTQNINIHDNNGLVEFNMPYLVQVDEMLITTNPALQRINFHQLNAANNILLKNNFMLNTADFNFLIQAKEFSSLRNSFVQLHFPSLLSAKIYIVDVGHPVNPEGTLAELKIPLLSTGSLVFPDADNLRELSAPSLVEAEDIRVQGLNSLEAINFSNLKKVTSRFVLTGYEEVGGSRTPNKLQTLSLPQLTSVASDFQLSFLTGLKTLSAEKLQIVAGNLSLSLMPQLEQVQLNELQFVSKNLEWLHLPQLAHINLPALTSVGNSLVLYNNQGLTKLSFPQLRSLGKTALFKESVYIEIEIQEEHLIAAEISYNSNWRNFNRTISNASFVIGNNRGLAYPSQHSILANTAQGPKTVLINSTLPQEKFGFGRVDTVPGSIFVFGNN